MLKNIVCTTVKSVTFVLISYFGIGTQIAVFGHFMRETKYYLPSTNSNSGSSRKKDKTGKKKVILAPQYNIETASAEDLLHKKKNKKKVICYVTNDLFIGD